MNPEIRKKAAIWLALVFILGAATGGVFGFSLAHRSYASTRVPSDAERRAKKVADMTAEIGLTPDQAQKVDALIGTAQSEIKAIHDQSDVQADAVRAQARDAMRAFLTPEQRVKFEVFVQKLDAERKRQKELQMGR